MPDVKQLTDFPDLSAEDTVSLTRSDAANANDVEFVLETSSAITWWKGLELVLASGQRQEISTENANHGPQQMTRSADDLVGAKLILSKAKMFGVHTGMYELHSLTAQRGRRLHFLWQRDDHSDGPVAGFFQDIGSAINDAADAVAGVVEDVANAVEEVVADVVESVGNGIEDALTWVGGVLEGIPVVGPIISGAFRWLGIAISAVSDLVGAVVKAGFSIIGAIAAGQIRVVVGFIGGVFSGDWEVFGRGWGDIASAFAGAILVVGGKLIAALQAIFFMQMGERPLTREERDVLHRVFRSSVALYNVRIVEGFAGLFSINSRAFTLGNTIYAKGNDLSSDHPLLVHECTHVWQYQNVGNRYTSDAVAAQNFVADAYRWEAELDRGTREWRRFNREAQASFLEDVFSFGRRVGTTATGNGEFYDEDPVALDVEFVRGRIDHTVLARETVGYVRGAQSWRLSGFLNQA